MTFKYLQTKKHPLSWRHLPYHSNLGLLQPYHQSLNLGTFEILPTASSGELITYETSLFNQLDKETFHSV